MNALREMELIDGLPVGCVPIEADKTADLARRIRHAQALYRHSEAAPGTIVETYLRSRGITLLPPVLRFIRWCPHRDGHAYPSMLAPVNVAGEQTGTHCTYLDPGGNGKYPFPDKALQRECRGLLHGGAVRLADYDPNRELIVGEGIESTASAMQLFDRPAWAALSTVGLMTLQLPPEVRSVVIAVDNDSNGAGQAAALSTYYSWKREGRSVGFLIPPKPGTDLNDVLKGATR
jgi:hypothetical protein